MSPTRCLGLKTPFEALFGFKPRVSHLRIFGSKVYAHISKADRKKLDRKALKCIFVGYGTEFKAYKLFNPMTHKVFARRDVIFLNRLKKERTTRTVIGTFHCYWKKTVRKMKSRRRNKKKK